MRGKVPTPPGRQAGFLAVLASLFSKVFASALGKTLLTAAATAATARKLAPKVKAPPPPAMPDVKARAAFAAQQARRRARRAGFNTILTSPLGAAIGEGQIGRRQLLGG